MTAKITEADLIRRVSKPFRYIGGELNAVRKDLKSVAVTFALVYPDVYEVGMSHLGLQILYHALNGRDDTACERAFAPWTDMWELMRERDEVLRSLESGLPLNEFDIVGITLQHELNYTNVLGTLDLARIPLLARDRRPGDPFVIAGGPCALNPAPLADFLDALVIGDGEEVVHEIVEAFLAWRREDGGRREGFLRRLVDIEGVYVPSLHDQGIGPSRIERRIVLDLDAAEFPTRPIVPFGDIVHDRAMVEVMRGCTRGCRFCHAGIAYRPARVRSLETLKRQCDAIIASTGYEEIAPLALNCPDYPRIAELLEHMTTAYGAQRVSASLPSLRMDQRSIDLAEITQRVKKTGLTFAPEAGSQRLRDAINKNVTERDILDTARAAFERGWTRLKLYFMMGLPTETDDDVRAIADATRQVEKVGLGCLGDRRGRLALAVSVNVFVPKPHTPFQWARQATLEDAGRKAALLRRLLRSRRIKLSCGDGRQALVEGAFARGGRELGPVLLSAYRLGCVFDGWSECFDLDRWRRAFAEHGLDLDGYATREWSQDEPLPWAHIAAGVSEAFLRREAEKALRPAKTEDCAEAGCRGCGVADPESCPSNTIRPPHKGERVAADAVAERRRESVAHDAPLRAHAVVRFAKMPPAHCLSHLEMARAIERAARRAGLPMAYSEGFAPRPRISYTSALRLGVTSEAEWLAIELTSPTSAEEVRRRLDAELPPGLRVLDAQVIAGRRPRLAERFRRARYVVEVAVGNGVGLSELRCAVSALLAKDELTITRRSKKGERAADLRPSIHELAAAEQSRGRFRLDMSLEISEGRSARPEEVVRALSETIGHMEVVRVHRSALSE